MGEHHVLGEAGWFQTFPVFVVFVVNHGTCLKKLGNFFILQMCFTWNLSTFVVTFSKEEGIVCLVELNN